MTDDLPRTLIDTRRDAASQRVARAGMVPVRTGALLPEGECKTCDAYRHETMFPRHHASDRCESGKHPHCTCEICW